MSNDLQPKHLGEEWRRLLFALAIARRLHDHDPPEPHIVVRLGTPGPLERAGRYLDGLGRLVREVWRSVGGGQ